MVAPSHEAIAAALVKVLSAHGPLSEDELVDMLVADGVDLGSDPEEMLADIIDEDLEPIVSLSDERLAWLPAVLDGRVFTHRLSAAEVEYDMVFVDADVLPLTILGDHPTYQRPRSAWSACGVVVVDYAEDQPLIALVAALELCNRHRRRVSKVCPWYVSP